MKNSLKPPRFVPTLTEVVNIACLPAPQIQTSPDVQRLVKQIKQQMQPWIEQKLNEELEELVQAVHATLANRWDELRNELMLEINNHIQKAVEDAFKSNKL
ncbi:MAG: hypothetical protein GW928_12970 [Rhodoferax sp.]|nr:hypothetical protein [Rhodoferax sp.]OIP17583.1 MAG: hypothetical protein AUK50_07205 [Comamonadaceae bacterium CG2_30_57_122]